MTRKKLSQWWKNAKHGMRRISPKNKGSRAASSHQVLCFSLLSLLTLTVDTKIATRLRDISLFFTPNPPFMSHSSTNPFRSDHRAYTPLHPQTSMVSRSSSSSSTFFCFDFFFNFFYFNFYFNFSSLSSPSSLTSSRTSSIHPILSSFHPSFNPSILQSFLPIPPSQHNNTNNTRQTQPGTNEHKRTQPSTAKQRHTRDRRGKKGQRVSN